MVIDMFKKGDVVRLKDSYRATRLIRVPHCPVASSDSVVVIAVNAHYLEFEGSRDIWIPSAFEHAGGPW